jgi:hypothetical protein
VADQNANNPSKEDDKANQEVPKDKTVGEKIVDILHSVMHGGSSSDDPVTDTIKTLRKTSIIGGDNRKARMDQAIKDSGG